MSVVRIQTVILSRVPAERALKDLLVRRRSFGRFALTQDDTFEFCHLYSDI